MDENAIACPNKCAANSEGCPVCFNSRMALYVLSCAAKYAVQGVTYPRALYRAHVRLLGGNVTKAKKLLVANPGEAGVYLLTLVFNSLPLKEGAK